MIVLERKNLIGPRGTTAASNLSVKFSVILAFRSQARYQVSCITAKISTETIFFRETKIEALGANVY